MQLCCHGRQHCPCLSCDSRSGHTQTLRPSPATLTPVFLSTPNNIAIWMVILLILLSSYHKHPLGCQSARDYKHSLINRGELQFTINDSHTIDLHCV